MMLPKLKQAKHLGDYRVWLQFDDGVSGEIDLSAELWGEIFEPLRDLARFAEMRVDPQLATLVWPNGADFAPEFLYQQLNSAYQLSASGRHRV